MRVHGESFAKKYSANSGCAPAHNRFTNDRGITHVPALSAAQVVGNTVVSDWSFGPGVSVALAVCVPSASSGASRPLSPGSDVALLAGVDAPPHPTRQTRDTIGSQRMGSMRAQCMPDCNASSVLSTVAGFPARFADRFLFRWPHPCVTEPVLRTGRHQPEWHLPAEAIHLDWVPT